jgi:hypothetical protein
MSKNQGEGDIKSAKRYNEHTRADVSKMKKTAVTDAARKPETPEEAAAFNAGVAKAKAGTQDQRDANVFRKLEELDKDSPDPVDDTQDA